MKFFLDDLRDVPDNSYCVARTYEQAIALLDAIDFEFATFDYFLQGIYTGYDVLVWMAAHKRFPQSINLHSGDPYGRAKMKQYIKEHFPAQTEITTNRISTY